MIERDNTRQTLYRTEITLGQFYEFESYVFSFYFTSTIYLEVKRKKFLFGNKSRLIFSF